MTTIEQYAAPENLDEAVRLAAGGNATLLAGGTDLMLQTRSGLKAFKPILVNLRRVPELGKITRAGAAIRIGALTTVADILENDLIKEKASILAETADRFASGQIRNTATLGGNVCNASPAGDMIIPLMLLDAEVELASCSGRNMATRTLPIADFFTGPGKTKMQPDEILTAFLFPAPGETFVAGFKKFGTRPALDISVVSVGIACRKEDGILKNVRVAFGAVAPVPLRGPNIEAALEGRILDAEKIAEAARIAVEEVSPISDVRASAWYRRELVRVLTGRLLEHVHEQGN